MEGNAQGSRLRLAMVDAAKQVRKVHGEPELSTDARAGLVLAGNESKGDGEPAADVVLTAEHALELAATQRVLVRNSAINLCSESPAGT